MHPCLRRSVLRSATILALSSMVVRYFPRPRKKAWAADAPNDSLHHGLVGFMLAHEQFRVPELVDLGVAAEQAGFDLIAASDHFQPWQANEGHSGAAWVTLSALGQRTRRIWMGTTVTCPTLRYSPAIVAESFATLGSLYPGRIFLGVGSGEALNEEAATGEWPQWSERSDRLVEATQIIRALWSGGPLHQKGRYYSVHGKLYDPPPVPIPILMAGNSAKALRRCGEFADGLVTDPGTWNHHRQEFQSAARTAGKDVASMPVLVELFVTVGTRDDALQAAALWQFLPQAFKKYFEVRDPEVIQHQAAAEVPLDRVIRDWVVSPDPAAHAAGITELFRRGATIVNIHSGQADQRRVIEFYGKEVLPRVDRTVAVSSAS